MAGKQKGKLETGQNGYPMIYLFPLIAVLAFIPALVYQSNVTTGLAKYDWFVGNTESIDFFLRAKSIWLYVFYGIILFLMLYMVFSEEIKLIWSAMLIPLFVYGLLCFVSACFSIDRYYSFKGIYEQYESVWMLLGYILLVYFAFYTLHSEEGVKRIIPWFVGGITFMTLLGICQATGHDPMTYKAVQSLLITKKDLIGKLSLIFGKGRTYMTLYNPNYVGFYGVLSIPLLLVLMVHTKKWIARILYALLMAGMFVCVFASQSRAGIVALGVALVVLVFCMRRVFLKKWYIALGFLVVAAGGFFAVNLMNDNELIHRLQGMFQSEEKETYALESIVTDKDVVFTINGNEFHVTQELEDGEHASFRLVDQHGVEIPSEPAADSEEMVVTDERFPMRLGVIEMKRFKGFYVKTTLPQKVNGIEQPVEKQWSFTNRVIKGDDSYYIKAGGASLFHIKKAEDGLSYLENHYSLANGRGYIWAKTWNILKKYPLLGSGPDTFLIAFPNDDLVGLYNSGHDGEFISKPHCLYLQIAAQTGIPSLIAFLVFFGWYLLSSIRLYWKRDFSGYMPKIGVAIMVSVIGYLVMGLTNDSCVAVAPIFFVLTGMGMGINLYNKQNA